MKLIIMKSQEQGNMIMNKLKIRLIKSSLNNYLNFKQRIYMRSL